MLLTKLRVNYSNIDYFVEVGSIGIVKVHLLLVCIDTMFNNTIKSSWVRYPVRALDCGTRTDNYYLNCYNRVDLNTP